MGEKTDEAVMDTSKLSREALESALLSAHARISVLESDIAEAQEREKGADALRAEGAEQAREALYQEVGPILGCAEGESLEGAAKRVMNDYSRLMAEDTAHIKQRDSAIKKEEELAAQLKEKAHKLYAESKRSEYLSWRLAEADRRGVTLVEKLADTGLKLIDVAKARDDAQSALDILRGDYTETCQELVKSYEAATGHTLEPGADIIGNVREVREQRDVLLDIAGLAWAVIATAGGGNWKTQHQTWQEAAAAWREKYFAVEKCVRESRLGPAKTPAEGDTRVHLTPEGVWVARELVAADDGAHPAPFPKATSFFFCTFPGCAAPWLIHQGHPTGQPDVLGTSAGLVRFVSLT